MTAKFQNASAAFAARMESAARRCDGDEVTRWVRDGVGLIRALAKDLDSAMHKIRQLEVEVEHLREDVVARDKLLTSRDVEDPTP